MSNQWSVYKHTSPSGKVYIGIAKDIKHRWRNKGSGYKGSTRIANAIKSMEWGYFSSYISCLHGKNKNLLWHGLERGKAPRLDGYSSQMP